MPRPWYKPHFTTLVAMLAVAAALAAANFTKRGDHSYLSKDAWGWPANCRTKWQRFESVDGTLLYSSADTIEAMGLSIDIAAALVLLFATGCVCEGWRRNGLRPWQFNLRWLLAAMTVGILIWWLQAHADDIYWWWSGEERVEHPWWYPDDTPVQPWHHPFPFYVVWPILFSEGCTLYAAGWLLVRLIHWLRSPRTVEAVS